MKKLAKTVFVCQSCGYQAPKWMGKCPDCGSWDAFTEEHQKSLSPLGKSLSSAVPADPVPINAIDLESENRWLTGISEFDRVLGGGVVPGTLVLIGGDPGIGKSTLMLQALHGLAVNSHRVLYVSGEESIRQIRIRSKRLGTVSPQLLVAAEVELDSILQMVDRVKPTVVVIDSIQTMFNSELTSAPGSISQVREATVRLMLMAKRSGIPVFLASSRRHRRSLSFSTSGRNGAGRARR